ncbi:MAG: leucine-rich repeat domain-containing protein [Muribaculaceae bacterium]|nr:leucine-rich repeat domain-containing protein [Muribaculaceae bacterium]
MKRTSIIRGYAFACMSFLGAGSLWADAVQVGDLYFTLDSESKTASVAKSPNNEYKQLTSVVIPGQVTVDGETYAVKSIVDQAFLDCNSLLEVTIEEGVESIGSWTFGRSLNIVSVSLPTSLTSVATNAFRSCKSITTLVLPDNLTSIGTFAFAELTSMTSLTLPANLTTVGGNIFHGSSSLTEVNFNTGLTTITGSAFYNCGLTTLTIPETITSISDGAFSQSKNLKTVILPETFTNLGDHAFFECNNLESINLPASLKNIGNAAFYNCHALGEVTIPESIEDIQGYAFYGCSSLQSVKWPEAITTIGKATFYECHGLTEIIIPQTVTSIGDMAFQSCSSLSKISLPEGITEISIGMFNRCSSLTELTIPSTVTKIAESAFRACGLKQVTLPAALKEVGNAAFLGCDNLEGFNVAEGNEDFVSVDGVLLNKDKSLLIAFPFGKDGEYSMPSSVTEIAASVFMNNTKLSGIRFSENLRKIGGAAFQSCTGVTDIQLPESLEEIGSTAFFFASNIQGIRLPNRDITIGNNAFSASGVKSMIFPETLTNIGVASENETYSVLTMNSSLEWVSLPSTLARFSPLGLSCNALKTIYCFAPVPPTTIGANPVTGSFVIKVPKGTAEAYAAAWSTHYPNVTFEDVLPTGADVEIADNAATLKWEAYSDEDFAAPSRYTVKLSDASSTVIEAELTGEQVAGSELSYRFPDLTTGKYDYELKGYVTTGQMTVMHTGSFDFETSGTTGIEASGATVAETRYYDITGREVVRPESGSVCIVRTVMTDGSVSVSKSVID